MGFIGEVFELGPDRMPWQECEKCHQMVDLNEYQVCPVCLNREKYADITRPLYTEAHRKERILVLAFSRACWKAGVLKKDE